MELPLAGSVLLAGARVVSASTVSLVSVGSLVGVHGLGYFFTDGFNRSFPTEILAGVIGTAVVALIFDLVLVALGKLLMPWTRAGAGQKAEQKPGQKSRRKPGRQPYDENAGADEPGSDESDELEVAK